MKNLKLIVFIIMIAICSTSCDQKYLNIPTDANGDPDINQISEATSDGITMLDDKFTVNAYLPNAEEGDAIKAEVLKLQVPPGGGEKQLLPVDGTQKELTVNSDSKVSVTYTRSEAELHNIDDYVRVTFGGKTATAQLRIDMQKAISVSNPEYQGNEVTITRNAGTAFFDVNVEPKIDDYSGTITVKRKNGVNGAWMDVGDGNYDSPAKVPISDNEFTTSDTTRFLFIAQRNTYADSVTKEVIASAPSFFLEKSASLSLTSSDQSAVNILTGNLVSGNDSNAILSVGVDNQGSAVIKGGSNWSGGEKSISFVPSTEEMYNSDNSEDAINAYNAGAAVSEFKANADTGIYIFKLTTGSDSSDTYYGMINISNIVPGKLIDFKYRIGNRYAHLSTIE